MTLELDELIHVEPRSCFSPPSWATCCTTPSNFLAPGLESLSGLAERERVTIEVRYDRGALIRNDASLGLRLASTQAPPRHWRERGERKSPLERLHLPSGIAAVRVLEPAIARRVRCSGAQLLRPADAAKRHVEVELASARHACCFACL